MTLQTLVFQAAFPVITPAPGQSGTVAVQRVAENSLTSAVNILLFLAGAAAAIYLILAGIKYITAGGDSKKATEARSGIINAIIGIIIITSAFFIIRVAISAGNAATSVGTGVINNPAGR
jgi:hypothetical protein